METKEQGLTKEEKVMFIILGIILLVSIGVLIINSMSSKKTELDNEETPITETSGQKDNIVDEDINEPEEDLIEDDSDEEIIIYEPVVNIYPSLGDELEDQSKPKPQPIILDWTFKNTMVTNAFSGDVITIERNVLLTNGKEEKANIVIMKYENESWITIDSTLSTFTVEAGLYKYIYSYGSSTKELLLTVSNKVVIDSINFLKLNETIDETSSITEEEYNKLNSLITNSTLESLETSYNLIVNNYQETNNLLPLVITFNEDITNKIISTDTSGITFAEEQKDWHETLTPNSILIWLDLNTIDITNNIVTLEIDGVTYELELNIIINKYEESTDTEEGELDKDPVDDNDSTTENDSDNADLNTDESLDEENEDDDNLVPSEDDTEEKEEELDPLEPTEEDIVENSSQEIPSLQDEEIEDNTLQPNPNDMSNELS